MIYVVVLNWNGWQDTIACLDSLASTKGVDYRVIVCDNGSTDGSQERIESWANGFFQAEKPEHPRLATLMGGSRSYSFTKIKRRNLLDHIGQANSAFTERQSRSAENWLTLIENEENLGFAAGNNSGILYALNQPDMSHIWLLNNDTLVEPDCLLKMMRRLEKETGPAVCGSRIMFFDDPNIIQALGGNQFNKWTGNAGASLGRYNHEQQERCPENIEQQLDYVSGCSMLVSREFIQDIGLMEESYFLYYEEIDWAVRSQGKYRLVYADDAVLYHKEGSSIGSASLTRPASARSEFYCFRNKFWFTRKYFPHCLPTCYAATLLQALNRWRRGYWASGWLIVKILFGQSEAVANTL